jgi:lipid II:glycine glycyltransferase (peptidoglycan interpeptide bridge formation enzyme)
VNIQLIQSPTELEAYDQWVKQHPQGNLWQSLERKQYVESLGKEVRLYGKPGEATALVVIDKTSFGLSTWEIPRGPLWNDEGRRMKDELVMKIFSEAKKEGCMSLFLSPQTVIHPSSFITHHSNRHVHAEATRIVDLRLPEAEILAQMHEKGRYNIKVAQKHGVVIQESQDLDAWMALIKETSSRDGFTPVSRAKYEAFLKHLPGSFLLLAMVEGKAIAGLIGVTWNGTGIYYYGASSSEHRNLMAPYLLQWEAMKRCKALGCHTYDLLGVASEDAKPNHPWQGISSFKAKFGGTLVSYPPEQEIVLKPLMKTLLGLKRKILG